MLCATFLLTLMHGVVRHVGADLHPFVISFFRNLFGVVVLAPLLLRHGPTAMYTSAPLLQVVRSMLGVVAMLCWFYGLTVVPIADATALSFTNVLFASLGAVFFLGERMRLRRWMAVALGFVGAVVILRPGFQEISTGFIMVLISSMCWGIAVVVVKKLSATDSSISIVAWMSIMLTLLSLPAALWFWQTPTLIQFGWLLLIGLLGTGGHISMVGALKLTDATNVLPLDFTRLLWAVLIGFVVFGEFPDRWTWLGAFVIIGSACYLIFREARLEKSNRLEEWPPSKNS